MIRIHASPESISVAKNNGLYLAEVTLDGKYANGKGRIRMTGAIPKNVHKMLSKAIDEWSKFTFRTPAKPQ